MFFDNITAQALFKENWEETRSEKLEAYRINQVFIAITLMLSMASEIEGHFGFGRNQKARGLWAIVKEYSDTTKDLWELRYNSLLPE
jgi:hypothetical protein